jgi:SAM-dependent methyltransferase
MSIPTRAHREQDLIAYYNKEAEARAGRELPDERVARRAAYVERLRREGRRTVLEVGCGPGRDGDAFQAAGFDYVGVDLAPAGVAACRARGLDARVASVLELPFEDGSIDAGWTMSTLLHVADEDLDQAVSELVRVLRPGAPLAVGLWEDGTGFGPGRFFSVRTDDELRQALDRHAMVEEWETWRLGDAPMHYQWVVLRTSQRFCGPRTAT